VSWAKVAVRSQLAWPILGDVANLVASLI
jgi:hypothetical protein